MFEKCVLNANTPLFIVSLFWGIVWIHWLLSLSEREEYSLAHSLLLTHTLLDEGGLELQSLCFLLDSYLLHSVLPKSRVCFAGRLQGAWSWVLWDKRPLFSTWFVPKPQTLTSYDLPTLITAFSQMLSKLSLLWMPSYTQLADGIPPMFLGGMRDIGVL